MWHENPLLRWTLANMIGWSLGLYLGSVLLRFGLAGLLLGGGVTGVCVGLAQFIALRPAPRWVMLSALGGLLAALPAYICAFSTVMGGGGFLLVGAVFGGIFGAAQWFAGRDGLDWRGWVAINGLAGALCGWLTLGFNPLGLPLLCTLGPLVFGLLTGWALLRSAHQP